MSRWVYQSVDVADVLGPGYTILWDSVVEQTDPEEIVREFEFRLESDAGVRPNQQTLLAQINEAMQVILPHAQAMAAGGDPSLFNALVQRWCKVNRVENPEDFLVQPPDPQIAQAQQQQAEAHAQMEQERHQAEMQRQEVEMRLKQIDAQIKQAMAEIDIARKEADARFEEQKRQMELELLDRKHAIMLAYERAKLDQSALAHEQEMEQDMERHRLDMRMRAERQLAGANK